VKGVGNDPPLGIAVEEIDTETIVVTRDDEAGKVHYLVISDEVPCLARRRVTCEGSMLKDARTVDLLRRRLHGTRSTAAAALHPVLASGKGNVPASDAQVHRR